jgi:peptide/nickel transport system substrate-binding protein
MNLFLCRFGAAALLVAALGLGPAFAQKQGGTLKVYFFDSPATMSIHEETTVASEGPMMAVFNNLVLFK